MNLLVIVQHTSMLLVVLHACSAWKTTAITYSSRSTILILKVKRKKCKSLQEPFAVFLFILEIIKCTELLKMIWKE